MTENADKLASLSDAFATPLQLRKQQQLQEEMLQEDAV